MGSPWGKNHQSQEFHIFPKQEITLKTCCTQPMGNVSMLRVMIDFKEQQLGHQSITLPVIGDLEGAYSLLPGSLSCTIQIYSFTQGWRAVPSWLPWASLPEGAVRRGKLVGPIISLLAVVDLGSATGCHLLLHPLSILNHTLQVVWPKLVHMGIVGNESEHLVIILFLDYGCCVCPFIITIKEIPGGI